MITSYQAFPATIHVPTDYLTIEAALHSAGLQDGDVVELSAGVYTGEGNGHDIDWAVMNNITLRGAGPGLTTIDAQYLGRAIKFPYIVRATIEGLSIINGRCGSPTIEGTYGFGGGGIYLRSRCTLELINVRGMNCNSYPDTGTHNNGGFIYADGCDVRAYSSYFSSNSATAGGGFAYGGNWIIENCTFYTNHGTVYGTGIGGVARNGRWNVKDSRFIWNSANFGGVAANTTWEATNCIFHSNYASNSGWGAEGDCFWGDYGSWHIYNCSFQEYVGLTPKNIFYSNSGTEGTLIAKNSIIWGSDHPFSRINGTLSFCDVQGSDLSLLNANNCISSDPKYMNPEPGGDLHLAAGSPAIDMGTSEGIPEKDLDQNARKHGMAVDLGAYEFQGPSVKLLSPHAGESFICGNLMNVSWTATDEYGMLDDPNFAPVDILFSSNGGNSWDYQLGQIFPSTGSCTFDVSNLAPSSECLVKVVAVNASSESNTNYNIATFEVKQLPIIYISTSGNDYTGRGAYSNPLGTVQQGLNGVAPSGEVRLLPGVYKGSGNGYGINWPDKQDLILRASPESTIPVTLDAEYQGRCINIDSSDNIITIEGITIQNGSSEYGGGIYCTRGAKLFLNKVIGKDCRSFAAYNHGGAFLYGAHGPELYVFNSIFYNNYTDGVGGVLYRYRSPSTYIYNSVFISNEAVQGGSSFRMQTSSITLENVIILGGGEDKINITVGSGYVYNSLVEGLNYGYVIPENCFSLDPKFISSSVGNFRLRADSPCIDHGITDPGVPLYDMDGKTRPKGRTSDVGAFEYQGPKYPPNVTIIKPNGGAILPAYSVCTIEWVATYDAYSGTKPSQDYISIMCSTDKGITWQKITDSEENNVSSTSGRYNWDVPSIGTTEVMIYVTASNDSGNIGWDMSDSTFEVTKTLLDTIYLSPSGNDVTGNGQESKPFRTVQKGLDSVADGGQVRLLSGVYTGLGNYNITWPETNNITLKAATGSSVCTLDAQGNGYGIYIGVSDIAATIEGLTIKNTYGSTLETYPGSGVYYDGGAIYSPNNVDISLIHCVLENNSAYFYGGGLCIYDGSLFASDCIFRDNRSNYGADIYFEAGSANVENCLFVGSSIEAKYEFYGCGSIWNDGSEFNIINCIFYDVFVPDDAYHTDIIYDCSMKNSIMWNNHPAVGGYQIWGAGDVIYSDIQDGYDDTGNISEEPRFLSTDRSSPDYFRFSASSPCIDMASSEAPSHDLAGNVRPHGIGNDMGVYEFQGTPDRIPPTGSVLINGGNISTETNLVTLTNSANDAISGMGTGAMMKFSNDGVNWSVAEPYSTTKSWALIAGSGMRTVHALYSDAAGNWMVTPETDSIEIIISSGTLMQQLDGFEGTTSGVTIEVIGSTVSYEVSTEEYESGKESLAVEYAGVTDASLVFKLPALVDMTSMEGVRLWLKGDGSSNYARIVLKESTVEADGELWQTPKFSLSDTDWHLVEYNFSTLTRASDSYSGNNIFDKIVEEYQIRFSTTSGSLLRNGYALISASDGLLLAGDVRIMSGGGGVLYIDGVSAVSSTVPPTVDLLSPNGGESLNGNSSYNITWTATSSGSGIPSSPAKPIKLKLSTNGGSTWNTIASSENTGSYSWTIPNVTAPSCKIQVEAKDALDHEADDESVSSFSITAVSGGVQTEAANVKAGPSPYNPATGNMMITYDLNTDADVIVSIYNLDGKLLWQNRYSSASTGGQNGSNSVEWDGITGFGSTIQTGVYIYQVTAGGKVIGRGKFIVRR